MSAPRFLTHPNLPRLAHAGLSFAVRNRIASVQERTRSLLRFVVAVGGYYDIETTVTFFTTGHFRESPDRRWRRVEPNPYGKWVFLKSNVDRVADRIDQALLWEMAALSPTWPDPPVRDGFSSTMAGRLPDV